MELQPDSDGEMREISVDAVMELDIRLYEEEQVELLGDLYAWTGRRFRRQGRCALIRWQCGTR